MGEKENSEMSFLEHLEELRWHIIRSLVAIILVGILAFVFKRIVFDVIILGPSKSGFFTNYWLCRFGTQLLNTSKLCINSSPIKLQNIQMAGQFTAHIKISLIAGIIMAFPYIFYEFWSFVRPALYAKERRLARGSILMISFLFFLGVLFGYYIICPLSINFLYNYQVSDIAINDIKLMSYISIIASVCLASGVLFELPVIVLFLSKIGLLTPAFLRKYRKHALVVILVLSAIITPPDIFSQILVSLPLLLLYEISIKISERIARKQELSDQEETN
ncbi:MAG: twin-arginine translocase subunit TatC [Bacteroidales bacterium]|jgi:sec-independent protein translocase protein TatC